MGGKKEMKETKGEIERAWLLLYPFNLIEGIKG
jgi:hypothetical protein